MDIQGRFRATICVVNYKTLDLTRLCLRSIRKYTSRPYEMMVADNHSRAFQLRKRMVGKVSRWINKIMQSEQVGVLTIRDDFVLDFVQQNDDAPAQKQGDVMLKKALKKAIRSYDTYHRKKHWKTL
jgi:hypothetical protein